MKRDRNLRIFQGQTVPQIVKTLLAEHQVQLEDKLTGSYRVWDYCVQYQESSFDFISRLMELEGIAYYYFRHEVDKHTLVLTDAPPRSTSPSAAMRSFPITRRRPAAAPARRASASGRWRTASRRASTASTTMISASRTRGCSRRGRTRPRRRRGSIDVYDWPGRFVDKEHQHGEFYARIRQEALAGGASADPGHRHGGGHRARQHLHAVTTPRSSATTASTW